MTRLPKTIYRFNAILHVPTAFCFVFFYRNKKIHLKSHSLEKEQRLTLPDFKTFYEATLIKQCDTDIKTDIRTIEPRNKPSPPWSIGLPGQFNGDATNVVTG